MHSELLEWYDRVGRSLPWRSTREPYPVWVSEIMCQQTQVATVIPYFHRWMTRFPDVQTLADADEQDVLAAWQGLGYYRRCRMLQAGARHIVLHGWPSSSAGWLKVPGVGRYTAGAIASICLGEAAPVVDGNVERVYCRLECKDRSGAWTWATENMHSQRPGDYNQALMELGALVCKPQNPDCQACPINRYCSAFQEGVVHRFPPPKPRQEVVPVERAAWVKVRDGRFGVRQIEEGKWWRGMWEFPDVLPDSKHVRALGVVDHTVTRHRIRLQAFLSEADRFDAALRWCTREELNTLPMPAPQRKVLALAVEHLG